MALRVEQFQTFVNSYMNHPDAGIKACDKKLKKDPSNSLYLIAQSQFQWKLRLYSEALATSHHVLEITPKERLSTTLLAEVQSTIVECQHGLRQFTHIAGMKIAGYWKQVLDSQKDLNLRIEMFQAAWRDEYWDLAQQLFARLQKEYPTNTQYHFAWIAFSQLQANHMDPDDKMASSLKMLAYRSLKAAFDNTLNDKETGKKISTSHHLRLATQIYSQQEHSDELLSLLQSPKVGVTTIGMNDGEFMRSEIDLLKRKELFDDLFETCYSKLDKLAQAKESKQDAVTIDALSIADDWFIWENLLESSSQTKLSHAKENTKQIIDRLLEIDPRNRNAGRALLTNSIQHDLLKTCLRFFDFNSSKRSCFSDLKSFLPKLSHQEQGDFLKHIDQAAKAQNPFIESENGEPSQQNATEWVSININTLKFEYFLCVSKVPLPEKDALENFVSDSLRMYKLALSVNKECGEEACILAVIGLVKLNHFARDFDLDSPKPGAKFSPKSYLIQAVYLLEFLRFNNPHNYSAILLSTTISQSLGLTTLASTALSSLKLKEIQHDTSSHLLWSRISITHPHDCRQDILRRVSSFNANPGHENLYATPKKGIETAMVWYEDAAERIAYRLGKSFESMPFDKVFEFSDFKHQFENSFARALMTLESRRITRLLNAQASLDPLPSTFTNWIKDNRDFDTIPDFEYPTTDKFYTFITPRPKPSKYWLALHTANDTLISLSTLKSPYPPFLVELLKSSLLYMSSNITDMPYQLTSHEQAVASSWAIYARIIPKLLNIEIATAPSASASNSNNIISNPNLKKKSQNKPPVNHLVRDWEAVLTYIKEFVISAPSSAIDDLWPTADILAEYYLRFEFLQSTIRFTDFAFKQSLTSKDVPKDMLVSIKNAAQEAGKSLNQAAKSWRQSLQKEGMNGLVIGMRKAGVTGKDVGEILDLGDIDSLVGASDILASAVESIEGLEKIKV